MSTNDIIVTIYIFILCKTISTDLQLKLSSFLWLLHDTRTYYDRWRYEENIVANEKEFL